MNNVWVRSHLQIGQKEMQKSKPGTVKGEQLAFKVVKNEEKEKKIEVKFRHDCHFSKQVNFQQPNLARLKKHFSINQLPKQIIFTLKMGQGQVDQTKILEKGRQDLISHFMGITKYKWSLGFVPKKKEELMKIFKAIGEKEPEVCKLFNIPEDQYKVGDLLIYFKNLRNQEQIKIINKLKKYIRAQRIGIDMSEHLNRWKITDPETQLSVLQSLFKHLQPQLQSLQDQNSTELEIISPKHISTAQNTKTFMFVDAEGFVFDYYEQLQTYFSKLKVNLIRLKEELLIDKSKLKKLSQLFPESHKKMVVMGDYELLLVDCAKDPGAIAQELYLHTWQIGTDHFTQKQLTLIQLQYGNRNLKNRLISEEAAIQSIIFCENKSIKIECSVNSKNIFIEQCKKILKGYQSGQRECYGFQNPMEVALFIKFYQDQYSDRFDCKFRRGKNHQQGKLFRINYEKDDEMLQNKITQSHAQLLQSYIKIVSLKPINSTQCKKQKKIRENYHYQCLENAEGYVKEDGSAAVGSSVYKMKGIGDVQIIAKPIEHLKTKVQAGTFLYFLDDELAGDSIIHSIIKQNKINYKNFLTGVWANKPTIFQKYFTDRGSASKSIILCHTGKKRIFRNQIETLFKSGILEKQNLYIVLLNSHSPHFIDNLLPQILWQISILKVGEQDGQGPISKTIRAHLYYEGGSETLQQIEDVMKNEKELSIRPLRKFCLDACDLFKIYSLRYTRMQFKQDDKWVEISPVVSYVCYYEFEEKKSKPSTVMFSVPIPIDQIKAEDGSKSFYIQLVYSAVTKICYFITHCSLSSQIASLNTIFNPKLKNWTPPHIQSVEQSALQAPLRSIIKTIISQFQNLTTVALSAIKSQSKQGGETIHYSHKYFLAKKDSNSLRPVKLCPRDDGFQIKADEEHQSCQCRRRTNKIDKWYEIETHAGLVEDLYQCMDF